MTAKIYNFEDERQRRALEAHEEAHTGLEFVAACKAAALASLSETSHEDFMFDMEVRETEISRAIFDLEIALGRPHDD